MHLIKRVSRENPLWRTSQVHPELAQLGHEVAEPTIDKYRVRLRSLEPGQRWLMFLKNHMSSAIACELFTVPTVTFKDLFVLVALDHGSRRILHMDVTAHPTAWQAAQQLVEDLGADDAPDATHLIRDRDGIYRHVLRRKVRASLSRGCFRISRRRGRG